MNTDHWIEHKTGDIPPEFFSEEIIVVQYRNGRQAQADKPWEASGWNHVSENWPNDIVKYRFVKKSTKRK